MAYDSAPKYTEPLAEKQHASQGSSDGAPVYREPITEQHERYGIMTRLGLTRESLERRITDGAEDQINHTLTPRTYT